MRESPIGWDYERLVRERLPSVDAVLDLGTGGGELLSSLRPLPPGTVATEAYPPNVPIARARLEPLGVELVAVEGVPDNVDIPPGAGLGTLPFADASFLLVIDRHESYYPAEIRRILRPGGRFLTQQVGGRHNAELNDLLSGTSTYSSQWNLAFAVRQLDDAGMTVIAAREGFPETWFSDIGALVYYLKAIPWQIPDFDVERYRDRLLALHERMVCEAGLRIRGHFFYLEAVKPDS